MKSKLLLFLFLLFAISSVAQTRFSKSYDLAEYSDLGLKMVQSDNKVIIASRGFCNYPISNSCSGLIAVDLQGNELWKTSFDTLTYFYENNLLLIEDTLHSLVVMYREQGPEYRLLTHDLSGHLLDNRLVNFNRPNFKIPYFSKTIDGWLLNVSERINGKWRNYLVWLNELLEPVNIKNYTNIIYSFQSFEMLELANGGFLIAGSYQTVDYAHEHGLILLDSTANVIWDRRFPPPYSIGIGGLIEAGDSNFIVTYPTEDFDTIENDYFPPTIQKVDSEGNVLWRHIFYNIWPHENLSIQKMENGDIVGVGSQWNAAGTDVAGWIFRISQDGEVIWDRAIAENRYGGLRSYIWDAIELPDGDLIFCGTLQDTVLNNDIPQAQINTWLVRTGADGCIYEDFCDEIAYTTSTEEVGVFTEEFSLFPNPVSDQVTIDAADTVAGSRSVTIYSLAGQVVKQIDQVSGFPYTLSLSELKAGFYLIQIKDDGKTVSTLKMVKH